MAKKKKAKRPVKKTVRTITERINLAWRRFILFLILFVFSLVLYSASSNQLFVNLFAIFSIVTGFVAFAFLIVLLVLWILKISRK